MSSPKEIIEAAYKENRTFLMEHEAKRICKFYGIPVTRFKVAKTAKEAAEKALEIGFPVVLKIISPDIVHKSDVGGVKLDLKSKEEVIKAYNEIMENVKKAKPNARIIGVLVQEMVPPSTEVIIGVSKDPQFGPAIMFGLGGIFVEILKDVSFRIAPLRRKDAEEMIREIKSYPILAGARGRPPLDIEEIIHILMAVSRMCMEHPEINQLDLNPIMVYEKGAKVVDARIILEKKA
ncbi:acetyl-CoA synthetase [archaeon]|nr:MAG: acetyl-CoA synthetase [archaeon]RLG65997.1 MAG: acetyl-CoA synthetase [archaeon]HDM23975.1 acetyl-CoA synthetase [Candidatus Bathyarchaeota archaeon]